MIDFEELRERAEQAVTRISVAQEDRHQKNRELMEVLARLEQRFAEREEELNLTRARIGPLERQNAELAGMIESLLDIVEGGLGIAADESLARASNLAAALLEKDTGVAAAEVTGAEPEAGDPLSDAPDGEFASDTGFEDAPADALAAEFAAPAGPDADGIPEIVHQAHAAAARVHETADDVDPITAALDEASELTDSTFPDDDEIDAEIAIPDPDAMGVLLDTIEADVRNPPSGDNSGLDVRSILARVEEIARLAETPHEDAGDDAGEPVAQDPSRAARRAKDDQAA